MRLTGEAFMLRADRDGQDDDARWHIRDSQNSSFSKKDVSRVSAFQETARSMSEEAYRERSIVFLPAA
jgi:hypothetical protein